MLRHDFMQEVEIAESKSTALESQLCLNKYTTRPLNIMAVRRELKKSITSLGKMELYDILLKNFRLIITTKYLAHEVLQRYGNGDLIEKYEIVGSTQFQNLVNTQKSILLKRLPCDQFAIESKLCCLARVLVSIKNLTFAPKKLRKSSLLKEVIFMLLLDVRLFVLKSIGYDFLNQMVARFQYQLDGVDLEIAPIEDPSHVIKRICSHLAFGEFKGADSNDWADLSELDICPFNVLWYNRDTQNVPITLEFISESTESKLNEMGRKNSAHFCRMVRILWLVWDSTSFSLKQKEDMLVEVLQN